ncbi:ParB N-terminal domain-containing protein [Sulfolobus acidocaldarius]|uniref:ParB-like protein Saci_1498 n=4 Tax=Sulfolobus acidocaldarius TaxID=2285 RepID=Y1498_SULAC|nr:ParB N-terminal domain-containing protein [Sulfolobus acidocaldarius]AAY80819.1 conserved protein [Sulfolobus acidocaldarius DSM 639]AGE71419.1 hypothetical protein SacN8_07275 [Sulfolobus acidocaldarius N8]AGE73692.1 hypothetical protein SacRon12I_07285 [Sulfolobus acidocaldarius Ron12/I]ALU30339.1 hypothetical protein ATY89_10560 [Sulfolobus acidocaldarius]ALU31057.1 hypothetical protein ATZ20_02115 [Sulfolobus acidocaldarius]
MSNYQLEWVSPKQLRPHEDVILSIVNENIEILRKDNSMAPIIVDKNSMVILDGHHRYYASLSLGLPKIPAIMIDYNSEQVEVREWNRIIAPDSSIRDFLRVFRSSVDGKYCVSYKSDVVFCDDNIYSLYWKEEAIEQLLSRMGYNVVKTADQEATISIPPVPKNVVIDFSYKGLRFPPKSTRHIYHFYIPKQRIILQWD